MLKEKHLTYHTRLPVNEEALECLSQCAAHISQVERSLFADIAAGHRAVDLKKQYLKRFQITARQFNACRIQVEGKIASIKAKLPEQIKSLKEKIKFLKKHVKNLSKKKKKAFEHHHKKRKLNHLECKLQRLERDRETGEIHLCFGSKKLFHAQFFLEENGFQNHKEWKEKWQEQRNSSFFVLGSKDETGGNQTCTAFLQEDGTFTLRLRLPEAICFERGKYLHISGVTFKQGNKQIVDALQKGQAINYRFKKDDKGWRLFVTTAVQASPRVSLSGNGTIGVDLNIDHLAIVETDRYGNPVHRHTVPLITYGKTKEQAKASIGDACAKVAQIAKRAKKPLVFEKLDFQKKKATLKEKGHKKYARMLSSFSYNKILSNLESRAWHCGIEVHEVNPAYSSLIARVKFSNRYGLSIHHAAALCLGRRYLKFSERPPKSLDKIPDGKGDHVALSVPVRNRDKHVWYFWGQIARKFKAALAERFRAVHSHRSIGPPKEIFPQGDLCDKKFSNAVGAIPTRESLALLFG